MLSKHSSRFWTGRQINAALLRDWPALLTVPYAVAACGIIAFFDAPVSHSLALAQGDAAVILDFAILVALPLGLAIRQILRSQARQRRRQREQFLAAHAQDRLLASRYTPQNLYRPTGGDPASGQIEVLPVWTTDGPVTGAKAYRADPGAFEPLDMDRFLAG